MRPRSLKPGDPVGAEGVSATGLSPGVAAASVGLMPGVAAATAELPSGACKGAAWVAVAGVVLCSTIVPCYPLLRTFFTAGTRAGIGFSTGSVSPQRHAPSVGDAFGHPRTGERLGMRASLYPGLRLV